MEVLGAQFGVRFGIRLCTHFASLATRIRRETPETSTVISSRPGAPEASVRQNRVDLLCAECPSEAPETSTARSSRPEALDF